jgi:hypothetical protein
MFLRLLLVLLLVLLFVFVFVIPMAKRRVVSQDKNQMYFKGNNDPRTLPPDPLAMRIGARLEKVMDEQQRISYGLE